MHRNYFRFKDESPVVQHQILNACIKLFLMRPADGNEIIQRLLKMATMENENPDLRDRLTTILNHKEIFI